MTASTDKQIKFMQRLSKDAQKLNFLKYFKEYKNLTYAAKLSGISKNNGQYLLRAMTELGFDVGTTANKGRLRVSSKEHIVMAVGISNDILDDTDAFLTERYGVYAPDSASTLGKALIDSELRTIGMVLVGAAPTVTAA